MGGDSDYRIDESCSRCAPTRPAPRLTARFLDKTVRLILVAGGCWLPICNASSPQVRSVQMPIVNGGDIPFTHISLEKGPALGIVNRIVQDNQGFLWFGFYHGLLRYDGYQFRPFLQEPEDPNSISGVNVRALFKDHTGKLWIGSSESLDQYDPVNGLFRNFLMGASNGCAPIGRVRDITEDR